MRGMNVRSSEYCTSTRTLFGGNFLEPPVEK